MSVNENSFDICNVNDRKKENNCKIIDDAWMLDGGFLIIHLKNKN